MADDTITLRVRDQTGDEMFFKVRYDRSNEKFG